MLIHYKFIENERLGDAPFMGALIVANNCNLNCHNCFNQKVKLLPTIEKEDKDIIQLIKSNMFNQGIIFGGLEWSLQMNEAIALARLAQEQGLSTMLYSGKDFSAFSKLEIQPFQYIKCGNFDETKAVANYQMYGVLLATSNQYIYKRGLDY